MVGINILLLVYILFINCVGLLLIVIFLDIFKWCKFFLGILSCWKIFCKFKLLKFFGILNFIKFFYSF